MSLELTRVCARARGREIVSEVTLSVAPGEVVAIVGPNGAGKTTLLRLVTGELAPSAGRVTWQGQPIGSWSERELSLDRGYLAQRSNLEFSFRSLEVVLLGRTPHGARSRHARNLEIAERAMRLTGVTHLASRPYTELSGGEQQRVQLARVLCQIWEARQALLLLDEPTSSLDLSHQHRVLGCAREMAGTGAAVLVVLHDLSLACQYAHRCAVMVGGQLIALGPSREVLTPSTVRRAFGVVAHRVRIEELNLTLLTTSGPDTTQTGDERPSSFFQRSTEGP